MFYQSEFEKGKVSLSRRSQIEASLSYSLCLCSVRKTGSVVIQKKMKRKGSMVEKFLVELESFRSWQSALLAVADQDLIGNLQFKDF